MKYIALLRGINVSGKNIIKMELLRSEMSALPVFNVSTYIQSGNILFESNEDAASLTRLITNMLKDRFELDITVIIVTPEDLENAIANNFFIM
ncbi:MAG: DUF1697 domain-containing protein [Sphingobacteriaceae bacterium]|nr:MAG: DUF1697 domain-containing protein [Sphingobacteriaceae bacterium]